MVAMDAGKGMSVKIGGGSERNTCWVAELGPRVKPDASIRSAFLVPCKCTADMRMHNGPGGMERTGTECSAPSLGVMWRSMEADFVRGQGEMVLSPRRMC
jgi:hypothetical protein